MTGAPEAYGTKDIFGRGFRKVLAFFSGRDGEVKNLEKIWKIREIRDCQDLAKCQKNLKFKFFLISNFSFSTI